MTEVQAFARVTKIITSGSVDKAALGFLLAAAAVTLAPISKNLPGFFNALVANFLPALAESFPKFLKKLPTASTCIVLSLIVMFFYFTN